MSSTEENACIKSGIWQVLFICLMCLSLNFPIWLGTSWCEFSSACSINVISPYSRSCSICCTRRVVLYKPGEWCNSVCCIRWKEDEVVLTTFGTCQSSLVLRIFYDVQQYSESVRKLSKGKISTSPVWTLG